MADPKAPPAPSPIIEGTVFIKNPLGAVHDMDGSDPRQQPVFEPNGEYSRNQPVLEMARKRQNGWQMASAEEIEAYCERHNIAPPGTKAKAEEGDPTKLAKGEEWDATDAAVKEAKKLRVDLAPVEGTGAGGTVTVGDVKEAAEMAESAPKVRRGRPKKAS